MCVGLCHAAAAAVGQQLDRGVDQQVELVVASHLLHAVGKPRDKFGVADPGLKGCDQTGPLPELLA